MRVYQFIATETSQRMQLLNEQITHHDKIIANSDIKPLWEKTQNIVATTKHQIESIEQEEKNKLFALENKTKQIEKDFKEFKTDNKIKHEPDYPETYEMYYAFALLLLLGETFLNGIYFAKGSEYGFLGGLGYAFGIAFVNLAFSFALGVATSNKNHIKRRLKFLGYLSIAGVIVWGFAYNLMVAHYRQQLAVDIDKAGTNAVNLFFNSPFQLDQVDYWILFLIGLVFSGLAYGEGRLVDDSYPGYGHLKRRLDKAEDNWEKDKEDSKERINEEQRITLDDLILIQAKATSTVSYCQEIMMLKETRIKNCENNIEQIESCSTILIKMYREINMHYRKTDPPIYFMEEIAPPPHTVIETSMDEDNARLKEQEELRDEIIEGAEEIKNTIIQLYNQAYENIANIIIDWKDKK